MKQAIFLVILILGCAQLSSGLSQFSLSYEALQVLDKITVPADQLASIKSYSHGSWIRPSLTMDYDLASEKVRKSYQVIMGVSTSENGWGNNNKNNDAFLNIYVNKWSEASGFIVAFDDDKEFNAIQIDIDYTALFGRWYYVYSAYLDSSKKVYFAVYNSYAGSWSEVSKTNVKKHKVENRFVFSVGTLDVSKSIGFNGYITGDEFTYDPAGTYFSSKTQLNTYVLTTNSKKVPAQIGVTGRKYFTIIGEQQSTKGKFTFTLPQYQGADEYCISGQVKYTPQSSSNSQLIYRVATKAIDSLNGASYVEGDRVFSAYFTKTEFCFATYLFNKDQTDNKQTKCFTVNISTEWFYFYQGYSRTAQKVFSYLRMDNQDYTKLMTNILHVDPNTFNVVVGKDNGTPSQWNGFIRSVTLEFGDGAYRETLITQLPEIKQVTVVDQIVITPTYISPTLFSSYFTSTNLLYTSTVEQKYMSILNEQAIHFWYRRDLLDPEAVNFDDVRTTQQCLAGVTEHTDYTGVDFGDNTLSITYRPHTGKTKPAYVFSTYNDADATKQPKVYEFEFDLSQDQGQWHWIYFAYNKSLKQATISIVLPATATAAKSKFTYVIENAQHTSTSQLKAMLGSSGGKNAAPGEFYDFQFVYYNGAYQNTQAKVDTYFTTYVSNPPSRIPAKNSFNLLSDTYFDANNIPSSEPQQFDYVEDSVQYSLYTWAQWNKDFTRDAAGNLLLSATIYDGQQIQNNVQVGDSTLSIVVSDTNIIFSTYNYGLNKADDLVVTSQSVAIPENFNEQWCFYYIGYSQASQQVIGSIKCLNGFTAEVVFNNINHIVPTVFNINVAKSDFYEQWNGGIHNPTLIVGEGLFPSFSYPDAYYLPLPVSRTPCVYTYAQCDYKGKISEICEDIPHLALNNILSFSVPVNGEVTFFDQDGYLGFNLIFVESVPCFNVSLRDDPAYRWNALQALFLQGSIKFADDNGNEISEDQAREIILATKNISLQQRKHLKRQSAF